MWNEYSIEKIRDQPTGGRTDGHNLLHTLVHIKCCYSLGEDILAEHMVIGFKVRDQYKPRKYLVTSFWATAPIGSGL